MEESHWIRDRFFGSIEDSICLVRSSGTIQITTATFIVLRMSTSRIY